MSRPYEPPTAKALERWHRLYRDAVNLLAKPMNGGGELSRSVLAVTKDSYPSADREHWQILGQWLKAARNYAHASPLERQTDAEVFADLTRWVGIVMGVASEPSETASPPEPQARFRADLDG